MGWYSRRRGSGLLFSELEMSVLDIDDQITLILEFIKEFGEFCIFGQQTNWHISDAIRFKLLEEETKKYANNHPDEEVDEEKVYQSVIGRLVQMAICHERFMASRDSEKEIRKLGLLDEDLDREEALNAMYAMCRIHEDGEATYMGFDNSPGSAEDTNVEFQLLTEAEARQKINKCNMIVAPQYRNHQSIYYLDTNYVLPKDLEDVGYQILSH